LDGAFEDDEFSLIICSILSRSKSDRRDESLKPLANGFESIFSLVIFKIKLKLLNNLI